MYTNHELGFVLAVAHGAVVGGVVVQVLAVDYAEVTFVCADVLLGAHTGFLVGADVFPEMMIQIFFSGKLSSAARLRRRPPHRGLVSD